MTTKREALLKLIKEVETWVVDQKLLSREDIHLLRNKYELKTDEAYVNAVAAVLENFFVPAIRTNQLRNYLLDEIHTIKALLASSKNPKSPEILSRMKTMSEEDLLKYLGPRVIYAVKIILAPSKKKENG